MAGFRFNQYFQKPAYGSYCFAHIPDTIRRLFGVPYTQSLPDQALPAWDGFQNVIFFFIDGFGWRFLQEYAGAHPFLKEITANGLVSQITSMFPSTTAVHTACIHSGMDVGLSGVHEWFYYEPEVDQIIAPLLFSKSGEKTREKLLSDGFRADQIFLPGSFYPQLSAQGVHSRVFNHREYAKSSFSNQVCLGADVHGYLTIPEALENISLSLEQARGETTYTFLYIPNFDTILHHYGPGSRQARAEIFAQFDQLSYFLHTIRRHSRTLLLFSADHGQSETDPKTTVYVNQKVPQLRSALKMNRSGEPLLFGGSPRDLFLYIQENRLDEIESRLKDLFSGKAEIYRTQDLVAQGLFGPSGDSPRLQARLGNLVILPYLGQSVFWYEKGRFEQEYFGHHGGLTPEEMLIPFIAYPVE